MTEQVIIDEKRTSRIRNMIVISVLIALVCTVSTYAWFVGMRTVNVSSFDVTIAGTDSLALSLNGADWSTSISIDSDTYDSASYVGNTNSWTNIFPVSTVGVMDSTNSVLKLYEKASLTATPGGYRLMASQMDNSSAEQDGYVVFDLFVKNLSGTQYITTYEEDDEEAIYLTNDSAVTVSVDGVENTGIENSVRVAFGQIGRVIATETDAGVITGITCTDDGVNGVTGICANRVAQIWEPNNTSHVNNAISWYDTSCTARIAADITLEASYSGSCGTVIDGLSYPTYAVNAPIGSANNVDVYDGAEYNTYESTTLLTAYDTFTDTEKLLTGVDRPTFMTLAPNSITKVRVYIYIEGQDIDNYDFASIGHSVLVGFGFTKERFTEDDIDYNGPDINQGEGPDGADLTAPIIVLAGTQEMDVTQFEAYVEPGVTSAIDNVDGDVSGSVVTSGTVDTDVVGTYYVTYSVEDAAGNLATEVRTVNVVTP